MPDYCYNLEISIEAYLHYQVTRKEAEKVVGQLQGGFFTIVRMTLYTLLGNRIIAKTILLIVVIIVRQRVKCGQHCFA
jgi:hypothetical protein